MREKMLFRDAPELRKIAEELQQCNRLMWRIAHIDLAKVGFLYETTCEPTEDAGDCRRVVQPWKSVLRDAGIDWDWVIEVYGYHAEARSPEWLKLVVYHELRHIGPDGATIPHTTQDWQDVLAEVGLDWVEKDDLPDITKMRDPLGIC